MFLSRKTGLGMYKKTRMTTCTKRRIRDWKEVLRWLVASLAFPVCPAHDPFFLSSANLYHCIRPMLYSLLKTNFHSLDGPLCVCG